MRKTFTPSLLSLFAIPALLLSLVIPAHAKTSAPPNQPPTVSLTAPAANTLLTAPGSILLSADALDADGSIKKVDFYQGSSRLATVTNGGNGAPYTFAWDKIKAGSYTLTAKATDNQGASTTSAPISLRVNAPPSASLTAPKNHTLAVAPASLTLSGEASDSDGQIVQVEFLAGTTVLATLTAAPYTFTWNAIPAGTYSLSLRATDNDGAVTVSKPLSVQIDALPTVALTAPADGTLLVAPASVTLSATANDSDGSVKRVDFYQGTKRIGSVSNSGNGAPYDFAWNKIPAGSYVLTAQAVDNLGKVRVSTPVNLRVDAPPKVSLTAPKARAKLYAPATITLEAQASDKDSTIARVDFYQGSTLIGSTTNGGNGTPYQITWPNVAAGSYSLMAVAIDDLGTASTSKPVTLTVDELPVVYLDQLNDGDWLTQAASLVLTAQAADSDGSIKRVEFFADGQKLGNGIAGTSTSTAIGSSTPYTFNWKKAAIGTYVLTAQATDSSGGVKLSPAVSVHVRSTLNQLPQVSLASDSPLAATPLGSFNLMAQASDADGNVSQVDFYNGSTLLGSVTNSGNGAPYVFTWDGVATGTYSLTAKATDDRGGVVTSAAISVRVNNPPNVALTTPQDGSLLATPTDLILNAQASDSDGTIAKVDFYQGSTLIGSQNAAPYTFTLTNAAPGSYTFTAQATDDSGAVTTSQPVSIVIDAPPSITLSSTPTSLVAPGSVQLSAQASDADGRIAQVDFYNGNALIGSVTNGSNGAYTTLWNGIAAGSYSLTAVATDNAGLQSTSAAQSITVLPNQPPTVSLSVPSTGLVAPANLTLTANAGDADGQVVKVEFYNGSTLLGSTSQAPFTTPWNAIAAGAYSLTAKVTDDKGATTISSPVSLTIAANQPPTIALSTPTDGQKYAAPASVTLSATASDVDGTIAKVDFYQGTSLLGTATSAPYNYAWSNVAVGSYSITATATDDKGASTTSAAASITVNPAQAKGVFYILPDHLGTPRAVTDESNKIVWKNDPLGEPFGADAPDEDPDGDGQKFTLNLRFPGQYFDQETGTSYNYFRDYDPSTGRYIESDPIGLKGGVNTYAYVGGNPLSQTDPLGLLPMYGCWGGANWSGCSSGPNIPNNPSSPKDPYDACYQQHDYCYAAAQQAAQSNACSPNQPTISSCDAQLAHCTLAVAKGTGGVWGRVFGTASTVWAIVHGAMNQ
jgi:RHS repeat-associated protein